MPCVQNTSKYMPIEVYEKLREEGERPSISHITAALRACSKLRTLQTGKKIHADVMEMGEDSDIFVANNLVQMYAKCGSMMDASWVFERMPNHDVISWTGIILGYVANGKGELALKMYGRMQVEGCTPDAVTYVAALKACASLAEKEKGKRIDQQILKIGCLQTGLAIHFQAAKSGHELNIFVATTLIDMYAKCGSMTDSYRVFERMSHHNVVTWSCVIHGYAQRGQEDTVLQLYTRMQAEGHAPTASTFVAVLKACAGLAAKEKGKWVKGKLTKVKCLEKGIGIHSQITKSGHESDIFVASTLIDLYAKCGSMTIADRVFHKMLHHDVVSWNCIILGHVQNGEGEIALELYRRMDDEGCAPDALTFVAALKACASLAENEEVDGDFVRPICLQKGIAVHSRARNAGYDTDIYVTNALVDLYGKCGDMVEAGQVFEKASHHDLASWNCIIMGYVQNNQNVVAMELYARMQKAGYEPDVTTFASLLKACGNLTALEIGKKFHAQITMAGLETETILATCLVDFYGKCGRMMEARQVFDEMTTPDTVAWSSLITAYSHQGHANEVFEIFERMQKVVSIDEITFMSVLNVCSHAGLVEKGKFYFNMMYKQYGITPTIEHYICMVDLLGRANELDEAIAMLESMPYKPNLVIWRTMLAASHKWMNLKVGKLAYESLLRLEEKNASSYVLMANIHAGAG